MTKKEATKGQKVRLYPAPPKGFDPLTATDRDLIKHGLPLRPDSQTQPEMAALWESQAAHYCGFEHLEQQRDITTIEPQHDIATMEQMAPTASVFSPDSSESCGYELSSSTTTFSTLFVQWTVPALQFSPSPFGINHFRTFIGLGFLDVHVDMTVDPQQNITSNITTQNFGNIVLPVRPGDVLNCTMCLEAGGRALYFLANETTRQTANRVVETGFPPASAVSAGVSRFNPISQAPGSKTLAQFGVVYFDRIAIGASNSTPPLTSGQAITMVNQDDETIARPVTLSDSAFRVEFVAL